MNGVTSAVCFVNSKARPITRLVRNAVSKIQNFVNGQEFGRLTLMSEAAEKGLKKKLLGKIFLNGLKTNLRSSRYRPKP